MFRKLVSNLPFNPSLIGTVTFYANRMHAEESIRRLGFGFVALAMFIQVFAVVAPPEKSLAYSNDYIINGLRTRDDILRAWDGGTSDQNVAAIYSRFGLTREDIAALPMYPNSTIRSDSADYWTTGRTSLSAVSKAAEINDIYKQSEIPVQAGSTTVYLRQLRAWDIVNSFNTYKAFEGIKNGKKFWILVDCGNFTQVGQPSLNTPSLQLRKTIEGSKVLRPEESIVYRFDYRNNVADSYPANNIVMTDPLDSNLEIIDGPADLPISNGVITMPLPDAPYTAELNTFLLIRVKFKNGTVNGTRACNTARLSSGNAPAVSDGGEPDVCLTFLSPPPAEPIVEPTPEPTPEPKCELDTSLLKSDARCVTPIVACVITNSDINRTTKSFTLKTVLTSSNPSLTSIQSYVYDYGDGSRVETISSTSYENTVAHIYKDGAYNATVVANYKIGNGTGQTDQTVLCSAPIDSEPDQSLSQSKIARNLTQNLDSNATPGSKAKAGDTIEYSLITHNSYDYGRANVNVSDYIGDILDYAELDQAFLTQQGGTFDATAKTLSWNSQTVSANSDIANQFRVKLKTPIPSTNQPGAMTTAFDCKISNKFGNQLDININCPLPKSAEYITERLPNTGPGTSLIIGFAATAIVAYFFARSRLLVQELELIRTDFAHTGGL
ncbi:hypothetical protein H0V99_00715 [Candidatus Saccharibacteria bacterium]|nr:hypothetical protein [Candidatus Saccharibacteria bacterium]